MECLPSWGGMGGTHLTRSPAGPKSFLIMQKAPIFSALPGTHGLQVGGENLTLPLLTVLWGAAGPGSGTTHGYRVKGKDASFQGLSEISSRPSSRLSQTWPWVSATHTQAATSPAHPGLSGLPTKCTHQR